MKPILVIFYSKNGHTQKLAEAIAYGIELEKCPSLIRQVADIENGKITCLKRTYDYPIVSQEDLQNCSALALGSPAYFGSMSASMKHFWDATVTDWLSGNLIDLPACVFTSSKTLHGGHEMALLSLMLPLLHHGALIVGLPYTEAKLHYCKGAGPYGAGHCESDGNALDSHEIYLARALGRRLALTTKRLNHAPC